MKGKFNEIYVYSNLICAIKSTSAVYFILFFCCIFFGSNKRKSEFLCFFFFFFLYWQIKWNKKKLFSTLTPSRNDKFPLYLRHVSLSWVNESKVNMDDKWQNDFVQFMHKISLKRVGVNWNKHQSKPFSCFHFKFIYKIFQIMRFCFIIPHMYKWTNGRNIECDMIFFFYISFLLIPVKTFHLIFSIYFKTKLKIYEDEKYISLLIPSK